MQPLIQPITQETLSFPTANLRRWVPVFGVLAVCFLFALNLYFFANSATYYLPYAATVSDMHINLIWSESIVQQGWLNPRPHHPYVDWMLDHGTPEEWNRWWGDTRVFQQSPLYAYVLAAFRAFTGDLIFVMIFQTLWAIALCACIGWIAFRVAQCRASGWLAFGLAAVYAPFHAYSVLLLRDGLCYTITAALLAVLIELQAHASTKRRQLWLSAAIGVLLGLGFLTREAFFVIVPTVWAVCGWLLLRRKEWVCAALLILATVATISPLMVRNALVGAPLFSSSNRFAEGFIWGHARSADPTQFVIPVETRQIFERSQGRPIAVIRETLATHPNVGTWLKLTGAKVVALLDPYELADNVSIYFMERMSPVVRLGLKYWMIVAPGFAGLILSAVRRDQRHAWLWLMLPLLLAGILIGMPMSRYRQILAVILIPSTAYLVNWLWIVGKQSPQSVLFGVSGIVLGWALCLGPFARVPRERYERAYDYILAAGIYETAGRLDESEAMKNIVREKFPEMIRAE